MESNKSEHYIKTLQKLIRTETISVSGDDNPEKFRKFHAVLKESFPCFFSQQCLSVEDFNGSLLMHWKGNSQKAPILLMSHHDVVDAKGSWSHEPFSADVADGKIYGRGTADTKASLWAMLEAAEELCHEGFMPENDIWFESSCNEETSGQGANDISKELEKRGIRFSFVLDEGGYILYEPIGGAAGKFAIIGVGEKGCADLKFIARSHGGHASIPGKDSPLVRLGKFMAKADKSNIFKTEINEVTQEMFKRLAPSMKGVVAFLLKNCSAFKPVLCKVMPLVSDNAGAILKTTLAFTMAQGSEGTNVMPSEAWVVGNMRYSHHQGQKESFRAVKELAAKYDVEMEIPDPGFPSGISDFRSNEFKFIESAVTKNFPGVRTVPYIMTGASDCRFFSRVSENCFRFEPFFITDEQLGGIHGIDENISIDALKPAVDFYKYIMQGGSRESQV